MTDKIYSIYCCPTCGKVYSNNSAAIVFLGGRRVELDPTVCPFCRSTTILADEISTTDYFAYNKMPPDDKIAIDNQIRSTFANDENKIDRDKWRIRHQEELKQIEKQRREQQKNNDRSPSIINCPACSKTVSNQAAACPHCGQPMAKRCPS